MCLIGFNIFLMKNNANLEQMHYQVQAETVPFYKLYK